ncbi:DUF427 domain-containing protein [Streptomyces sp. NPDC058155]|uniref:DUF427 domain-containing protein n=1 Tax=Streptomyces sp. NPDC058155 TaxID=3346359 RepID=UPI0036E2F5A3
MGLSWQQGPLAPGTVGQFLVPDPLPERMLYAEPLRRRMQARLGDNWVADSEDVVLLHEPGRYPVAYFPLGDIAADALERTEHTTEHQDLGPTSWFTVHAGPQTEQRAAWQHIDLPGHAKILDERVAFAWRAMDAYFEEDERIVGHAADAYHRIDIRSTSRHLVVRDGERVIADSRGPLVLYESGFAPRWYIPREDVDRSALTPSERQTFCPYKGMAGYYDIGSARHAAWSYEDAWDEVRRISGMVSFEPDEIQVDLDGVRQSLDPGQSVVSHGADRNLDPDEAAPGRPA